MPSNAPRRFVPEPIEQTSKSSRQQDTNENAPKPRRFAPEPVGTTSKSSKDTRHQKENVDIPKARRFAPELLNTVAKSSKYDHQSGQDEESASKPRRFAPQVVEESHKSSKEKTKKHHIKFTPEPVSTTYGGNRRQNLEEPAIGAVEAEKKPARKFAPILLDTAKRSRKAGDLRPILSHSDRTEDEDQHSVREHRRHLTGSASPLRTMDVDLDGQTPTRNLSPSGMTRKICPVDGSAPARAPPVRNHSFRMPELDTIESSESERETSRQSSVSSAVAPGISPITASDSSHEIHKHATRARESVDESFSHYLLDVERKKAQRRLEEQALAAFPNADFGYEPPHHYVNNDDDSDDMEIEDRPVTFDFEDEFIEKPRRDSTNTMSWEQIEAQKHAEEMQRERNVMKLTAKQPSESMWWEPSAPAPEKRQPDSEMASMRDRARPPMLGNDLVFPRCPSPEPARFDVTQSSSTTRNQMRNAEQQARSRCPSEEGGLWQAPGSVNNVSPAKSRRVSAKDSLRKGLWGGFCMDDGEVEMSDSLAAPSRRTGLMTPRMEDMNPLDQPMAVSTGLGMEAPPTPPASINDNDLGRIDSVLVTERELDDLMKAEFPDSFITQVYNYLSLGYPSLARPFDEELGKISRISISELRGDDERAKADPRGYIRLGPDFEGGGGDGMTEDSCMRWQALKRYVREWARQEKNMDKAGGLGGNWGTAARRGSWGN